MTVVAVGAICGGFRITMHPRLSTCGFDRTTEQSPLSLITGNERRCCQRQLGASYLLENGSVHVGEWNWVIVSFIVHSQICRTNLTVSDFKIHMV